MVRPQLSGQREYANLFCPEDDIKQDRASSFRHAVRCACIPAGVDIM